MHNENPDPIDHPISDNIDNEILMHRDAHFGGKFSLMIDYYNQEGKGVMPEFGLERILFLAHLEDKSDQNLSPLLLSGREACKVANARNAYKKLRDIYEKNSELSKNTRLIADLILSEEDYPEKEIDAIAQKGSSILPLLIDLLNSEDFLDPLFPGYGFAPELAAICLGKIKSPTAISPLFEALGKEGFFMEESILEALKRIGEESKRFLIKIVTTLPLSYDNEKAALALTYFSEDEEVAKKAFELLQNEVYRKKPSLATYLIFACEGLRDTEQRKKFKSLSKDINFLPPSLLNEMRMIYESW